MAAALNRVILLGKINSEPAIRQVSQTETACCFGLTVVTQITNLRGQAVNETCYVDVEVAGQRAQNALAMFHQGAKVFVTGRLRMLSWQDRSSGRRMTRLVLRAIQIQGTESSGLPVPEPPPADADFDPTEAPEDCYSAENGGY